MHRLADWCSLKIGRSLSIVPSGWQRSLGLLRDAFKSEHGRSRLNERGSDALGLRRRVVQLPIGLVDYAVRTVSGLRAVKLRATETVVSPG